MATLAEQLSSRIPPHSLEAERAVLGALLLERESLPRAIEVLRASDFYKEGHRQIFASMIALFERNEPVDLLTLSEELRRQNTLEGVGGAAALAALVEEAATAAHVVSYANIVREKALVRDLIRSATEIIGQSYEQRDDIDALLDQAEGLIFQISERRLLGSAIPVRAILKGTFEYIERLYDRKEHVTGLATGFGRLDELTSGFQPSDFIIIAGRPSMGKAQPLHAKVKTLTGWKPMGELRLGDELASVDGRRSRVSGIFPQGPQPTYRVTFSDGRLTTCTGDHLWRVHHRAWREPRTLSTERVADLLRVGRYRQRLWVDVPSGDFGHEEPLPVDPWLLGALLGNGRLWGRRLGDAVFRGAFLARALGHAREGLALRAAGGDEWRVRPAPAAGLAEGGPEPLRPALGALGLWGVPADESFVPDLYLNASRRARLELLRGLRDPAGRRASAGSAHFSTTSERLARNVVELVRSLGGWCALRRRSAPAAARGGPKTGRPAVVWAVAGVEPASIGAPGARRGPASPRRRGRPAFVAIEPAGVRDTQCISVTHPSGLYVTDDYVVTHNTAFALNVAKNAGVVLRKKVLVLSLEMSKEQLVQRLLCAEARVDSQKVRTGYLEQRDWHRLTNAAGRLADAPIFIDDTPALSVLEARAKARRMKAEHGLDLVVIDYLQLMRGRNVENRQQEISEISRSLKALAKELAVPVVALSQLSRAVEARQSKDYRPQLSDLRESGALEQDADLIIFLYRPDRYGLPVEAGDGNAEAIIGKQRNGPVDKVPLVFLPEFASFEDPAPRYRNEPQPS